MKRVTVVEEPKGDCQGEPRRRRLRSVAAGLVSVRPIRHGFAGFARRNHPLDNVP